MSRSRAYPEGLSFNHDSKVRVDHRVPADSEVTVKLKPPALFAVLYAGNMHTCMEFVEFRSCHCAAVPVRLFTVEFPPS